MATLETCLATTKEIRNHIRDLELPDSLDKTYKTGPDEVVQVAGRACGGNHHPGSIPPPCGNYPASSGHQSGTRFDQAQVKNVVVKPLCKEQRIPTVNGSLPGPTINVREGDTLVVHVINNSTFSITIHWHGVFQLKSPWMDGANMITQCPIQPRNNFTYRFDITGQEGTLFWHAHVVNLRATLHGALIIRPRSGRPYPFPKPYKEVPLVFGQWWDTDIEQLNLRPAPICEAYLINGLAGDSYPCSENRMFKLKVIQGKTYLLRIINAALNTHLFFKIADHNVTVVSVDAAYTTPYGSDVMILTPGQTVDALLTADQPIGMYYMSIIPYLSASSLAPAPPRKVINSLIVYKGATSTTSPSRSLMPSQINSVSTAHRFSSNITSLVGGPYWTPVPRHVDEKMFVTMGLGLEQYALRKPSVLVRQVSASLVLSATVLFLCQERFLSKKLIFII
ncbi:unnamed protein product [Brassica napus]|uniref:laccase n=1 Tax=Brassica napus TaxID=3708 RepID=A0A816KW25_BRANA|nr:unnamed protein product [Brassica napus]